MYEYIIIVASMLSVVNVEHVTTMTNIKVFFGLSVFVASLLISSQFFFGPSYEDDDEPTTEETLDNFSTLFEELKKFILENKRLPSSKSKTPKEKRLAIWCTSMRSGFKKRHLTLDKIASLECVPYWTWDPILHNHYQTVSKLKEFIATHNRLPSKKSINDEEKALAKWCMKRKQDYRSNRLSNERIHDLESIALWSWNLM